MIKLIATDMDGTLLDERGEVDLPRLERLLDHLDQKGFALSWPLGIAERHRNA